MRKSRILTSILTVVFILANVAVPSFAADISYTYGAPTDVIPVGNIAGPIGNLPLHVSHKIDDEGATYDLSQSYAGFSVSEDGILTITSAAAPASSMPTNSNAVSVKPVNGVKVNVTDSNGTTVAGPTIATIYPGFDFPFDDGVDPGVYGARSGGRYLLKNYEIVTEGTNKYASLASNAFIGVELGALQRYTTSPFILEMDLKGLNKSIELCEASNKTPYEGGTILGLNGSYGIDATWANAASAKNADFISSFNANDGEWHTYKWVIIPSKYTKADGTDVASKLDLYIDGQMVVKGALLTGSGDNQFQNTAKKYNVFPIYAAALDNFKRYGTSLGFAHDVKLSADTNTVGATLTYSASIAHMPTSNIPETLECALMVSDTLDGEYTELATGLAANGTYTIPESAKGKYLKAAARVVETIGDQCASEWVLSGDFLYINDGAIVNDPAIDSVSLSVNGASCADLEAENILTDANIEAGTADIAISISASSESGKTVKFVLAQYNKVEGVSILKNVAVSDVALTSTAASCDLSLTASGLNADTEFKLFALTSDGLVPVDLINLQ